MTEDNAEACSAAYNNELSTSGLRLGRTLPSGQGPPPQHLRKLDNVDMDSLSRSVTAEEHDVGEG